MKLFFRMALVVGIGVGLFLLIVVWFIAIFLYFLLSRAAGAIAYGGIGAVLAAIALTLILWFTPRGEDTDKDFTIYDEYATGRIILLFFSTLMLVVGGLFLTYLNIAESVHAKVLRD